MHDGRTKSYINSDVAAELGLNGPVETVTLSTLNGNVKTFQITSVKCEMGSTDGKVNHNVSTYTTDSNCTNETKKIESDKDDDELFLWYG